MMRNRLPWAFVVLACLFAGCNDVSQHRLGGVRTYTSEGTPKAAPALLIANAPAGSPAPIDSGIKAAGFTPPGDGQLLQHPMRVLYQRATQRHATMDSYTYRLKRREVVGGVKQPEELIEVKLRREPYSVYLKWLGKEGNGRETIYVAGKYDNKMQVRLAANDAFPFSPAGFRMALLPDDALVKAKSRYSITSTGLGSLIERYGEMVAGIERGDPRMGTAKHLPQVKREGFDRSLECVHQMLPPQSDPNLPKGGERFWYFDPAHGLPVLILAHDAGGEVEYYCHDQIQAAPLSDDDFNPDRLWRK